ncbi:MAG: DUF1015 domain-containing protein [Candidatus Omnitrophica bacterium]|nr:DUF1015 domain-containing protein [Candidatus Omnitrophota bacterium]
MVEFRPFRGLRYDRPQIDDLGQVVAPPYDVITDEERRRLEALHPSNIVRLILSREQPGDTPTQNRYTRAATLFVEWQRRGILVREEQPAFYLYRQTFTWELRRHIRFGILGALTLEDPAPPDGRIRLHEQTLSAPKADRRLLVEAVRANLSPVFCLYTNTASQTLTTLIRRYAETHQPSVSIEAFAQSHQLWVVTDPELLASAEAAAREQALLIADGHHRYEVGWELRRTYPAILAYLTAVDDPGVVVGPIHRLVHGWPAPPASPRTFAAGRAGPAGGVESLLGDLCRIKPVAAGQPLEAAVRAAPQGPGVFGLYTKGRSLLVSLKDTASLAAKLGVELPGPWQRLDVPLLEALLSRRLGVAAGALEYVHEAAAAQQAVDEGRADAAWLVRPTTLEQITSTVAAGSKMPPKSTFFYPKLLTGLVMNLFTP